MNQSAFESLERARWFVAARSADTLMFLTVDGFAYCPYKMLPPGARAISVGFFGMNGIWVEHIQDFGRVE